MQTRCSDSEGTFIQTAQDLYSSSCSALTLSLPLLPKGHAVPLTGVQGLEPMILPTGHSTYRHAKSPHHLNISPNNIPRQSLVIFPYHGTITYQWEHVLVWEGWGCSNWRQVIMTKQSHRPQDQWSRCPA